MLAKGVLAGGILAAAVVFLLTAMTLRLEFFIPFIFGGPLAIVPAIGIGYGAGLLSEKFSRVLNLRCRTCGWASTLIVETRTYGSRGSSSWLRASPPSETPLEPPQ
ncbi:MAG: hypothetical protein C0467_31830 [Planctomycetaceae bacterium]|nr:hypothetical protein [Planctomycetaceae bacterium]